MRILLALLLVSTPLAADLAQVRAEPNLEKRSRAALELAAQSLKASRQAYGAGELEKAQSLLDEVEQSVALAETSLDQTGKNPSKSPKHFKHAEIRIADLLRKIEAYSQDMNAADRPMVDKVRTSVREAHERLLDGIMMGRKK